MMTRAEFVLAITPEGVHMSVVAINPEDGKCSGRAYTRATVAEAEAWLAEREHCNQYWTPNPLRRPVDKKPVKADVAEMRWVHLDADDPSDAMLARLRGYRLLPTLIVFSGGGYQAFWRLREPVQVVSAADIARCEAANRRVLADLDPEHPGTHNLDRIMRLPGTRNWPTAAKLAKGRTGPVEARVVEYHPAAECA